jgi:hypothetical protein
MCFIEVVSKFVQMKYPRQYMISSNLKQVKDMPQELKINEKTMVIIKLVFQDDYFSNKTSYNNINITSLKTNRHAMKEG